MRKTQRPPCGQGRLHMDKVKFDMSTARVLVFDTFFTNFETQSFDVPRLIRDMKSAKVNCLRLAAYSHLGYAIYPSKSTPMFPGLEKDLFTDIVDSCRKEGIAVIAYVNAGFDAVLQDSSSFGAKKSDGTQKYWASDGPPWGVRWMCFNQPRYHELIKNIIDEVMAYDVEGCYFDETVEGFCHCDVCRDRYLRETGHEMPKVDHWTDSALWKDAVEAHEYMAFRKRVLLEWRRFLVQCTKSYGQEKLAMINCGGYLQSTANSLGASTVDTIPFIDGLLTESMIRASDSTGIRHGSDNSRFADNAPFRPWVHVELKSSSWTFDVAPKEELMVKTGLLAAHGARPAAYTYHQNGQAETLKTLVPAYERVFENEDFLSGSKSCAEVGLLYHRHSHFASAKGSMEMSADFDGMLQLLGHCHLCYDIIDPALTAEAISGYAALVIPEAATLNSEEATILRNYISKGGACVITGECATHDRMGNPLPNSELADLLGCDIVGRASNFIPVNAGGSKAGRRTYFNLTADHPMLDKLEKCSWHPKSAKYIVVKPTSGEVLSMTIGDPDRPPVMGPSGELGHPSIIVNKYGAGHIVYLPWQVGSVYQLNEPHGLRKLLDGALNWLLGDKRIVKLEAPGNVEISLRRKGDSFIFHMVDCTGSHKIISEQGLMRISGQIKLPDSRQAIEIKTFDGAKPQWRQTADGVVEFDVAIDRWQALIIATTPRRRINATAC